MNIFKRTFAGLHALLWFVREYRTGLLRGFITFVDNTLVYLFDKKPRRGPLFVNWTLLYRCNARCSFCNTHELNKSLQREVTTEEALTVIRQLGRAGTWHLSLTGGEPLLRDDLGVLIKEAKKFGMFVNVNTNGFLLAKKAAKLVESGVDSIIISMDSHQEEIHDQARGIPGLSRAALKGIEEVKRLRTGRKPALTLRTVISRKNYQTLADFIDILRPLVDKIYFQPIHDGITVPRFTAGGRAENRTLLKVDEVDSYMFPAHERGKFAKIFTGLQQRYPWLDTAYHHEIETFLFDKDTLWARYRCYSGFYYLAIDPYGRTYPCAFLIQQTGDIRDSSVITAWKNDKSRKFRQLLKRKKNRCLCWCGISEVNLALNRTLENRLCRRLAKVSPLPDNPPRPQ